MRYIVHHPLELLLKLAEHIELVALSLFLASLIAFPLGIFVARKKNAGRFIIGLLNIVYTIPSLALFALFIPWLGIGFTTAVITLTLYAQMILVRNISVGMHGVAPEIVDAARGLGMSHTQILTRIELPLALPAIFAGFRIATLALISLATLAAWIAAGGLGDIILYGLQHDDPDRALAGSLAAAILVIAVDKLCALLLNRNRWNISLRSFER